jgi:ComF family protein
LKASVFWRGLGDVFFPPRCVHCQGLVEESGYRHVCARCAPRIEGVRPPHCAVCGYPFFGIVGEEGRACPACAALEPAFATGCTAVLLRGPARSLILELKYQGGRHVLGDIEEIFRRSPTVLAQVRDAVLVPVPLHPRKERERGYNQSVLLAQSLARVAGGSTRTENLLRRVVDTPTQTAFDRRDRAANLKNAFALRRPGSLNRSLRYILVDDVFTTGSTLNGCARVLRRAGCLNLAVATFGHG